MLPRAKRRGEPGERQPTSLQSPGQGRLRGIIRNRRLERSGSIALSGSKPVFVCFPRAWPALRCGLHPGLLLSRPCGLPEEAQALRPQAIDGRL